MATVKNTGADASASERDRLASVVREHIDFVFRVLRRQGLSGADADDGVQRVFLVFREKAAGVLPGAEKGYLFRVATLVAKELRRGARRLDEWTEDGATALASPSGRIAAADFLEKAMVDLDDDERSAFVLYEIEGLTMAEMAKMLDWPEGTAASRLRRAREKVKARSLGLAGPDGGFP